MKGQVTGKMFALTRFGYIEVLFYVLLYWGKENCSLYWALHYIEVCFEIVTVRSALQLVMPPLFSCFFLHT